ncbi:hypothetical protein GGI35DRAFT_303412 [Trichoderma velutinum]
MPSPRCKPHGQPYVKGDRDRLSCVACMSLTERIVLRMAVPGPPGSRDCSSTRHIVRFFCLYNWPLSAPTIKYLLAWQLRLYPKSRLAGVRCAVLALSGLPSHQSCSAPQFKLGLLAGIGLSNVLLGADGAGRGKSYGPVFCVESTYATATPTRRAERRQNKRSALTGTGLEWAQRARELPRGYYGVRSTMLGLPPHRSTCVTHTPHRYILKLLHPHYHDLCTNMLVCTLWSAPRLKLPREVFSTESRHM